MPDFSFDDWIGNTANLATVFAGKQHYAEAHHLLLACVCHARARQGALPGCVTMRALHLQTLNTHVADSSPIAEYDVALGRAGSFRDPQSMSSNQLSN